MSCGQEHFSPGITELCSLRHASSATAHASGEQ